MDDRNRGQQGEGAEDRKQQGGNMPGQNPAQKKPAEGENQGEGIEDRNQGQGGERKSA